MTYEILQLIIISLGLALTPVLFRRFPKLPSAKHKQAQSKISVIIPARNEATNLPLILKDLQKQSTRPLEIICVDDASTDTTPQIATEYGAKVIAISEKPDGWIGKAWACQQGVEHATGELLLFLDADVRLAPDGIARILQAYTEEAETLSVQPYHETVRPYEQFSLIFNLIQTTANGTTTRQDDVLGLHGPVILITRDVYEQIGGHESVRKSVIEDLALGQTLKQAGFPFRVFIGDTSIRYRMYADGLMSLFQGWLKNIASGAALMPFGLFLRVFLWISSMLTVPFQLVRQVIEGNLAMMLAYCGLYIIWVILIFALTAKLGRFRKGAIVIYPIVLVVTVLIFFVSLIKRIFGMSVTWKGRSIPGRAEP